MSSAFLLGWRCLSTQTETATYRETWAGSAWAGHLTDTGVRRLTEQQLQQERAIFNVIFWGFFIVVHCDN